MPDHIHAGIIHTDSGLIGAGGVVPVSGVDFLDLNIGIDGFGAGLEALVAASDLGAFAAADDADLIALSSQSRDDAHQVAAGLQLHIVAGGVLLNAHAAAQQEVYVRILLRHGVHGFAELVAVADDHIVAVIGILAQSRIDVSDFIDAFHYLQLHGVSVLFGILHSAAVHSLVKGNVVLLTGQHQCDFHLFVAVLVAVFIAAAAGNQGKCHDQSEDQCQNATFWITIAVAHFRILLFRLIHSIRSCSLSFSVRSSSSDTFLASISNSCCV